MVDLITRCPKCNTFLHLMRADGAGLAVVTMKGNSVHCATCGNVYRANEGVFATLRGIFEKIADAEISKESLEALLATLRSVPVESGADVVREAVQKEVPDISDFLTPYWGLEPTAFIRFIRYFVILVAGILAGKYPIGATTGGLAVQQMINDFEKTLDQTERRRQRNRKKAQRRAVKTRARLE